MTDELCPECNAPEGHCYTQSGSMGGRQSCYRDKTVAYTRIDWLAYVAKLEQDLKWERESHGRTKRILRDLEAKLGGKK